MLMCGTNIHRQQQRAIQAGVEQENKGERENEAHMRQSDLGNYTVLFMSILLSHDSPIQHVVPYRLFTVTNKIPLQHPNF